MSEKKENKTRLLNVATQIYGILVAKTNPEKHNMRDAVVASQVRQNLETLSQISIGTARVLIKAVEDAKPPQPPAEEPKKES